jgi:hypothetical protein
MPSEKNDFLAARIQLHRPVSQTQILWSERYMVSLHVALRSQGPFQHLDKSFPVREADAIEAQALLADALQTAGTSRTPDCLIEITAAGKPARILSWSLSSESKQQREVRHRLEQLAHVNYTEALAFLERGRALGNDPESACRAFEAGIETLGNGYSSPDLIDDTEAKLILARSVRQKGNLKQAATLMERVLQSRTSAYAQRFRIQ